MKFSEFYFNDDLMKGIQDAGFEECTPVQVETFRQTLPGRDVEVQSQTGTGKTAAFLLSIFELFHRQGENRKRALVIAPTRELAVQIEEEAKLLGKHLSYTTGCFYGGVGYGKQEDALKNNVDIMIGTPGRVIDFLKQGKMNLADLGFIVIDEADRLFDMGFLPDLKTILKKAPPREQRTTMLFSATLGLKVQQLAWEYMNEPVEIAIEPEQVTVDEIDQCLYHVSTDEKLRLLLGILKKEEPENAIIFTNTKSEAVVLSKRLTANGYSCEYIMGDLPQNKRLSIIEGVKDGKIRFLVATDVAARGLHIDDLSMVINYDIPEDFENYVHRIGRTARAGNSGKAITLACEKFVYGLEGIEKFIGRKIPVEWFDESMLVEDVSKSQNFRREYSRSNGPSRGKDRFGRPRSASGGRSGGRPGNRGGSGRSDNRRSGQSSGRPDKRRSSGNQGRPDTRREQSRPQSAGASAKYKPAQSGEPAGKKQGAKPSRERSASAEARLEYYRQKYGEDFQFADGPAAGKGKRKQGASAKSTKGKPKSGGKSPASRKPASKGASAKKREPSKNQKAPAKQSSGNSEQAQKKGIFGKIKGLFGKQE